MAYDNLKIDDIIVILFNGNKVENPNEYTEQMIANNKVIDKIYTLNFIQTVARGQEYKVVSNLFNSPSVNVLDVSGLVTHYLSDKIVLDSDGIVNMIWKIENNVLDETEISLLIEVSSGLDTVASNRSGLITMNIYNSSTGGTLLSPITARNSRQSKTPIEYLIVTPYNQNLLPTLSGLIISDDFVISEATPAKIFEFISTIDDSDDQTVYFEITIEPLGGTGKATGEVKLDIHATNFVNLISIQEKDLKQL